MVCSSKNMYYVYRKTTILNREKIEIYFVEDGVWKHATPIKFKITCYYRYIEYVLAIF